MIFLRVFLFMLFTKYIQNLRVFMFKTKYLEKRTYIYYPCINLPINK